MSVATLFAQGYYNDSYLYQPGTNGAADAVAASAIMMFVIFGIVMAIGAYVLQSIMLGKIFKKAGQESWKAWVPIYNNWIMLELGGQQGFWAVLALIPVVNIISIVFMYIAMYNIGLKLGKEGAFVLLAIFLPIVWIIWLAVDGSTWKGKKAKAASAQKA